MSYLTQFPTPEHDESCDVVIGFDFGTSCTKVVVRTPTVGDRAFAVPFDEAAHSSCQHLLPTVLWVSKDGGVSLSETDGAVLLRDIKYHMIENKPMTGALLGVGSEEYDPWVCATAFVAMALREVRGWFLQARASDYRNYTLEWQLNVGMPSADYANREMCAKYLRTINAAWILSLHDGGLKYAEVEKAVDTLELKLGENQVFAGDSPLDRAELSIVPEVAAGVAGYARSDRRRLGLHLMVDVGASTFDVCSFRLQERDGDDFYPVLTTDVKQLGALYLYKSRVDSVREATWYHADNLWDTFDPVDAMPPKPFDYLPRDEEVLGAIDDGDKEYEKQVSMMIWSGLSECKLRRDPRSKCWNSYIPVFLTGGASQMGFYQDALENISRRISSVWTTCQGLNVLALEKPDSLVGDIDGPVYHRLVVAWGLSYSSYDIGEVIRPEDIEDIQSRGERSRSDRYISKDDV